MNILVIGSGGREHALVWKLLQSRHCPQIFVAPGNAGTAEIATNIAVSALDFEVLKDIVLQKNISMLVVGPEDPLVAGIFDFFQKDEQLQHVQVVGPSAEAAKLEGSKAFAKVFMQENNIPTAEYREFSVENLTEGIAYIATQTPPIVLKADGLAAGKGVLICQNIAEAQAEFRAMIGGKFGEASQKVVIEQFFDGVEFSVFALTDGKSYQILPPAKDYKRVGEGDTGLNTGGMGAVSPVPFADAAMMKKVEDRIVRPTIEGLQKRKMTYHGFVFFGLICVKGEPFVIEYNVRLGDPETEVVLPRLENDLLELFLSLRQGNLAAQNIKTDSQAAATVMLVASGYPNEYEKGKIMTGWDTTTGSFLFHAGTKKENNGDIVTNGGRILAITSFGKNISNAVEICIQNAEKIKFEGKNYRKDIGKDV